MTAGKSRAFRLGPVDRLTIGYLLFSLAVAAVGRERIDHAAVLAAGHVALLGLVLFLARARTVGPRFLSELSEWYPLALFVLFFEEIQFLVHGLQPGWFDEWLIRADYSLFGAHPTVWIEQFASYWLTEYLQFAYTSYFVLTIGVAVFLRRRHGLGALRLLMAASSVTYYACYVTFVLFPIEGPYHTLAHLQQVALDGGPFTAVIEWIERYGRVHGGAFPSAHVAGSMVALLCAWRYSRRAGLMLVPVVLSIVVATVYGRYHYFVDLPAGILVGVAGYAAGRRLAGSARETAGRANGRG